MEYFSFGPNMGVLGTFNFSDIIIKGVSVSMRSFESRKEIRTNDITSVFIRAECANVIVKPSEADCVTIVFFGSTTSDTNPTYKVENDDGVVTIEVDDVLRDGLFAGKINLEVSIPCSLELIDIRTDNGNVSVLDGVVSNCITLKNMAGKVESYGSFLQLLVSTQTGSVKLFVIAKNDVRFDVMSKNGDVELSLRNVEKNEITFYSKNGRVKNYFIPKRGGFGASGKINTKNGQIMIS